MTVILLIITFYFIHVFIILHYKLSFDKTKKYIIIKRGNCYATLEQDRNNSKFSTLYRYNPSTSNEFILTIKWASIQIIKDRILMLLFRQYNTNLVHVSKIRTVLKIEIN